MPWKPKSKKFQKTEEEFESGDTYEDNKRDLFSDKSLMEFIPAISPRFASPYHLVELVDALEGCVDGTIKDGRYVISIPMRHGKSETCTHLIAWALLRNPKLDIMYISYNATQAQRMSRKARDLYIGSGGCVKDGHNTIGEWCTGEANGGGIQVFTGIDGQIAGKGAHLIIIDDPLKGREMAESPNERQKAADFVQEAISRLHPGGCVFLVSARWHVDDPSGQLLRKEHEGKSEYTHIHKRAIEDEGLPTERALWPDVRPLDNLKRIRREVGEYNWFSWFQGEPRPPDSNLFQSAAMVYDRIPESYQIAIGLDLGFTEFGDSSAAVVMARDNNSIYYILRVEEWRKNIVAVSRGIKALQQSFPTASLFQYVSGNEKGTLDLLREPPHGIDIFGVPARYNKYARAMPCADRWNRGDIRIPKLAAWDIPAFVNQIKSFTGLEGDHDDMVDAMVSAFDALDGGACSGLLPGFYGKRVFS